MRRCCPNCGSVRVVFNKVSGHCDNDRCDFYKVTRLVKYLPLTHDMHASPPKDRELVTSGGYRRLPVRFE